MRLLSDCPECLPSVPLLSARPLFQCQCLSPAPASSVSPLLNFPHISLQSPQRLSFSSVPPMAAEGFGGVGGWRVVVVVVAVAGDMWWWLAWGGGRGSGRWG